MMSATDDMFDKLGKKPITPDKENIGPKMFTFYPLEMNAILDDLFRVINDVVFVRIILDKNFNIDNDDALMKLKKYIQAIPDNNNHWDKMLLRQMIGCISDMARASAEHAEKRTLSQKDETVVSEYINKGNNPFKHLDL